MDFLQSFDPVLALSGVVLVLGIVLNTIVKFLINQDKKHNEDYQILVNTLSTLLKEQNKLIHDQDVRWGTYEEDMRKLKKDIVSVCDQIEVYPKTSTRIMKKETTLVDGGRLSALKEKKQTGSDE